MQSNLTRSTFENLDLDVLMFYDAEGSPVWRQVLRNGAAVDAEMLNLVGDSARHADLIAHTQPEDRLDGLLRTPWGPMLVSSRPIVPSAKRGATAGTVIMGAGTGPARSERLRFDRAK